MYKYILRVLFTLFFTVLFAWTALTSEYRTSVVVACLLLGTSAVALVLSAFDLVIQVVEHRRARSSLNYVAWCDKHQAVDGCVDDYILD